MGIKAVKCGFYEKALAVPMNTFDAWRKWECKGVNEVSANGAFEFEVGEIFFDRQEKRKMKHPATEEGIRSRYHAKSDRWQATCIKFPRLRLTRLLANNFTRHRIGKKVVHKSFIIRKISFKNVARYSVCVKQQWLVVLSDTMNFNHLVCARLPSNPRQLRCACTSRVEPRAYRPSAYIVYPLTMDVQGALQY